MYLWGLGVLLTTSPAMPPLLFLSVWATSREGAQRSVPVGSVAAAAAAYHQSMKAPR